MYFLMYMKEKNLYETQQPQTKSLKSYPQGNASKNDFGNKFCYLNLILRHLHLYLFLIMQYEVNWPPPWGSMQFTVVLFGQ